MNKAQTPREIEIRAEIADLNTRIFNGIPANLDLRREELSRELTRLIAARLIAS